MSEQDIKDAKDPDDIFPDIPEYAISSQSAYGKAAANNLDVVLPKGTELFIDIDNYSDMEKLDQLLPTLREFFPDAFISRKTNSPSGKRGRFHVVVELGINVDDLERVTLQACLGSDRKRELLAWRRIDNRDPHPTLFFEKKGEYTHEPF